MPQAIAEAANFAPGPIGCFSLSNVAWFYRCLADTRRAVLVRIARLRVCGELFLRHPRRVFSDELDVRWNVVETMDRTLGRQGGDPVDFLLQAATRGRLHDDIDRTADVFQRGVSQSGRESSWPAGMAWMLGGKRRHIAPGGLGNIAR